jgi:hypothetical protein
VDKNEWRGVEKMRVRVVRTDSKRAYLLLVGKRDPQEDEVGWKRGKGRECGRDWRGRVLTPEFLWGGKSEEGKSGGASRESPRSSSHHCCPNVLRLCSCGQQLSMQTKCENSAVNCLQVLKSDRETHLGICLSGNCHFLSEKFSIRHE